MIIEQIYTGCLAQGAYYIQSENEAAIIDPLREIEPYLDRAEKGKAKIKYVFETHFHADFVSGHVELKLFLDQRQYLHSRHMLQRTMKSSESEKLN